MTRKRTLIVVMTIPEEFDDMADEELVFYFKRASAGTVLGDNVTDVKVVEEAVIAQLRRAENHRQN